MKITDSFTPIIKKAKFTFVFALIAMVAASCSDVSFNSPKTGKGTMKFQLTDAPGDYDEVNIDIQGLRVHYTPFSSDTGDTSSSDSRWIDIPVEPLRVNLLELNNGVDTLLAEAELDPGYYRELRLILGNDNDVVVDGMTKNLKVPSGQQSGFKIKFSAELEAEEELEATIDFDAARSVHQAGRSGKYILKPVLKAFVSSVEQAETGSVSGIIEPAEAEPVVYAIMQGDTSGSTIPEDSGEFLLPGLDEGIYELSIDADDDQYIDATVENVEVEVGDETNVGTVTLEEAN